MGQRQQTEFIHIEDISSRSQQHDWFIKPHRHGKLFQLLIHFEEDQALFTQLKQYLQLLQGEYRATPDAAMAGEYDFNDAETPAGT
jgi:AraC family transcriptional activator of pobA